jgi:hypothetical protein
MQDVLKCVEVMSNVQQRSLADDVVGYVDIAVARSSPLATDPTTPISSTPRARAASRF